MTPEQQEINRFKDCLEGIAIRGIRETLHGAIAELDLLNHLLSAGIGASAAELSDAYDNPDTYAPGPSGDEARARRARNSHLSEQLSSILATVSVAICALASVTTNAEGCNRAFKSCDHTDIEPALIDALTRQPQCLDDEATELAMQQDDDSATAMLRRHLRNALKEEEQW